MFDALAKVIDMADRKGADDLAESLRELIDAYDKVEHILDNVEARGKLTRMDETMLKLSVNSVRALTKVVKTSDMGRMLDYEEAKDMQKQLDGPIKDLTKRAERVLAGSS